MSVVAVGGGDNAIALAVEGGDAFAERLRSLSEAQASLAKAYADLNIGKDAAAEYDKARELRTQAEEMVVKARAEATDIIQAAKDRVKTIEDSVEALREEARDTAVRLDSDCARARQETDDYAAKVLTEVGVTQRSAERDAKAAREAREAAEADRAKAATLLTAAEGRVAKIDQALLTARSALKEV